VLSHITNHRMSVHEITDFSRDVLERSRSTPVLVDFWAEWCAPCRTLGPILERVTEHFAGRVVLVKVDTDRNPELSTQYGIRGIPAVKLFVDGVVKDEFTGALPEERVLRWLERALPNKMQKELDRAVGLLEVGDHEEAEEIARAVLRREPANAQAAVIAAQAMVWRDATQSAALVATLEEDSEHFPVVEAIRTIAHIEELAKDPASLAPAVCREDYLKAARALAARDFRTAVDMFISVLRAERTYDDDGARKACIAIFRLLGDGHEITRERRRDFSSALSG
jgi:putative thioredoxin